MGSCESTRPCAACFKARKTRFVSSSMVRRDATARFLCFMEVTFYRVWLVVGIVGIEQCGAPGCTSACRWTRRSGRRDLRTLTKMVVGLTVDICALGRLLGMRYNSAEES